MCGNILDIAATNSPDRVRNVIVDDKNKFCCSDHHFISFDTAIRLSLARPVEPRKSKLYSKADFPSMDNYLTNYLFMHPRLAPIDTPMTDAISSACQLYVPTITIPRKKLPKWFDGEARHLLKQICTSVKRKNTVASNERSTVWKKNSPTN